jgi:hypothetical protein
MSLLSIVEKAERQRHHRWRPERGSSKRTAKSIWYAEAHADRRESRDLWKRNEIKTGAGMLSHCLITQDAFYKGENYAKASLTEAEFTHHVSKWRRETKHYSSVTKMVLHPSYLRIIGMGRQILPLLLNELQVRRDHWLVALNAITGEDPAEPDSTFNQAVDAWLRWGRVKGYLG